MTNISSQNDNETYSDLEIDNLPNRLTIFRVLLVPVVLVLLFFAHSEKVEIEQSRQILFGWLAAICFTIASITDFFDGYIARKRNIQTVFGSFLDPIADKFLVVSSLIMLQYLGRIPVFIVIILVLRELYMTSLRLLANNEGISIPVNQMGKWKTALQMIGIGNLMAAQTIYGINLTLLGSICIYISCLLSIWSSVHYSFNMIKKLKEKRIQKKLAKKNNRKI